MAGVVEICQELLRIPSLSGQEKTVVERIEEFMKEFGFDEVNVDKYGNITGVINGNKPGKTLLFDAHMDVVPVSDEGSWSFPPFGGMISDGKVYGRGASDMKGSLSAMLAAGQKLATDRSFCGRVVVAGIVHEECFEGIASREVSKNIKPDYVVIGEATQLKIACGQKGRVEITVETFGKSAHSANPEKGVNAVLKMTRLIDRINSLPFSSHEKMGKGILALTDIISTPYPGASVVPNHCRATYDRRILAGETRKDVLRPFEEAIAALKTEDPEFEGRVSIAEGTELCYTGEEIKGERFFPPWILDTSDPFVEKAEKGLVKAGIEAVKSYYAFCTNGSHYAGEAGIKTIGFGPSMESLAHVSNEYIELQQLKLAAEGFFHIARSVLDGYDEE